MEIFFKHGLGIYQDFNWHYYANFNIFWQNFWDVIKPAIDVLHEWIRNGLVF
jgi:hypothetical protein